MNEQHSAEVNQRSGGWKPVLKISYLQDKLLGEPIAGYGVPFTLGEDELICLRHDIDNFEPIELRWDQTRDGDILFVRNK
jgi:hypothetical protein